MNLLNLNQISIATYPNLIFTHSTYRIPTTNPPSTPDYRINTPSASSIRLEILTNSKPKFKNFLIFKNNLSQPFTTQSNGPTTVPPIALPLEANTNSDDEDNIGLNNHIYHFL